MAYNTLSRSDCNISSTVKVGIVTSFTGTSRKQMELCTCTSEYHCVPHECKIMHVSL